MEGVLITGTGLISRELGKLLINEGYRVTFLSTSKSSFINQPCYYWNIEKGELDQNALDGVQHIIHLAGEGIADKRWTKKRKQEVINSRVRSTELLLATAIASNSQISTFISASGIGYYGAINSNKIHSEDENPANDFIGNVCELWEDAANKFESIGTRVVKLRTGIVLSNMGGALPRLAKPIKYLFGAKIGNGKQIMPWIHIDDICRMYHYFLVNKHEGSYNAVSTEIITNKAFTKEVARQLNRPLILPLVPIFVLKLLFGEMAILLYTGSAISAEKVKKTGFEFNYKNLSTALTSFYNFNNGKNS